MKKRTSFVSNSSSSSYIVCRPKEIDLRDFADKIVDYCLDKEIKWLDKEYKNYEIVKSEKYNHPDNIENRKNEREHLRDIFENCTVKLALPIYFEWAEWFRLFTKSKNQEYYNDGNYEDEMMLGGKIPLDMFKKYLEEGEKFYKDFDSNFDKMLNEVLSDEENYDYQIEMCKKNEDKIKELKENQRKALEKDIEWLKTCIDKIENKNCEFYGMRVSSSGDCPTHDGIYSFDAIGPFRMSQFREGINVVEKSESW